MSEEITPFAYDSKASGRFSTKLIKSSEPTLVFHKNTDNRDTSPYAGPDAVFAQEWACGCQGGIKMQAVPNDKYWDLLLLYHLIPNNNNNN